MGRREKLKAHRHTHRQHHIHKAPRQHHLRSYSTFFKRSYAKLAAWASILEQNGPLFGPRNGPVFGPRIWAQNLGPKLYDLLHVGPNFRVPDPAPNPYFLLAQKGCVCEDFGSDPGPGRFWAQTSGSGTPLAILALPSHKEGVFAKVSVPIPARLPAKTKNPKRPACHFRQCLQ